MRAMIFLPLTVLPRQKEGVTWGARAAKSGVVRVLILVALQVLWGLNAWSEEVSFRNDVMAVLSKAGCNAGACHGNAKGKAGFKLSLRGEDAQFDFDALTRDQFGRRTNPMHPADSLVLLKATTEIAHEGGKRFAIGSEEYKVLLEWIERGARSDIESAPRLERLEVIPEERFVMDPEDEVRIQAWGVFADGRRKDVTQWAVYEAASPTAKVTSDGRVRRAAFGETTILVRYLDQQRPVRLAFVPQRPGFEWRAPMANNYIDEYVFAKLRQLRMNPSEVCADDVFLRRAYLDLLGLLPTPEEARRFVQDGRLDKRSLLIEQLLSRPEFAQFWALKWSDLLRNEERGLDQKGVQNFHRWIAQGIAEGKPLDAFVRELISARGSTYLVPAANFYRANRDPISRAEAAAQVFLGTRLQCAQCHNHPFDRWTQDDYYNWAAVFGKVQYKVLENRRQDSNDKHEFKGEQVVFVARKGDVTNARTGGKAQARFLGGPETARAGDELEELAGWLTSPENPFFARSQVNRIWFHLMGRGIVDPIDDFRATNPASHPELLEALAHDFSANGYDLRRMIRAIMNSKTYQLSSVPNETNMDDEANYSHGIVRRLTAEQLLDAQSAAVGAPLKFQGYPAGLRASELPGARPERLRGQRGMMSAPDQFLELFGKPPRLLTCECERTGETTMGQAFQMISGPVVNELLTRGNNRLGELLGSGKPDGAIVEELYWAALSRGPGEVELKKMVGLLASSRDRRAGLEDIAWGLLNSKEFILRR